MFFRNHFVKQSSDSILLITLDSCRYDTFLAAQAPRLKTIGPLWRAMAPGNFTYASHAAMFMGFTPGVADRAAPHVNPKFSKLFRVLGVGHESKTDDFFVVTGRNVIAGARSRGYRTLGAGAVGWFDPSTATGRVLTEDFDEFFFAGHTANLAGQLQWIRPRLQDNRPTFLFLNVGETHVPYYFEGAPWRADVNPCIPFGNANDAAECRRRQVRCVEYVDGMLAGLLEAFSESTIVICGDHGDCWGEDGLWEHGISHPKVLEVPLVYRLGPRPAPPRPPEVNA